MIHFASQVTYVLLLRLGRFFLRPGEVGRGLGFFGGEVSGQRGTGRVMWKGGCVGGGGF